MAEVELLPALVVVSLDVVLSVVLTAKSQCELSMCNLQEDNLHDGFLGPLGPDVAAEV